MVAAPEVVAVKAQPRGPLWYGEAILDLGWLQVPIGNRSGCYYGGGGETSAIYDLCG
jgi:hypothetical protein